MITSAGTTTSASSSRARLDESGNTVRAKEWLRDYLQENVRSPLSRNMALDLKK